MTFSASLSERDINGFLRVLEGTGAFEFEENVLELYISPFSC